MNLTSVASLSEIEGAIHLFPSPAKDFFKLSVSNENLVKDFTSLSISNNLGLIIRKEEISFKDKSLKIDIEDLADGVYLISLSNSNNEKVIKRLIVAK